MKFHTRIDRITRLAKRYDKDLYAIQSGSGQIQIWRRAQERAHWDDDFTGRLSGPSHFILALTDNWLLTGKDRDWGLEPIWQRLQDMDGWRKDGFAEECQKQRERNKELNLRAVGNEFRAIAADIRTEFARATNDINTSTLEKTDPRAVRETKQTA